MSCMRQIAAVSLAVALLAASSPLPAQQTQDSATPQIVIRATTELVLVNVVARDKKGNLIRDLKKEDFTLLEDGKKQTISTARREARKEWRKPAVRLPKMTPI